MDANFLRFLSPKSPISTAHRYSPTLHPLISSPRHQRYLRLRSTNGEDAQPPTPPPPTVSPPPPETAELVRFRRRSKRRARQRGEEAGANGAASRGTKAAANSPKKWEDMSIGEKAMELYVGEKGALFWLNKFAYASIFIVIGGWIVFRFVGPALNLYQLDAPPLPPSAMFKGEE